VGLAPSSVERETSQFVNREFSRANLVPFTQGAMSTVTNDQDLLLKQSGWEKMVDPTSGRPFYLNHQTKATQWEPPTGPGVTSAAYVQPAATAPTPSNPGYAQQQFAQPPQNNAPAAGSQDMMAQMMMMQMVMSNQQAQNAALIASATRNSGGCHHGTLTEASSFRPHTLVAEGLTH
jgi:hypothetical protein